MKHKKKSPLIHASCFMLHEKGFSLLELIIYIAIITVISGVFVAIIFNLNLSSIKSKTETEAQQNLRNAMQAISQTIRSAQNINAPAAGASGTILTAVVNGQNVQYSLGSTASSTATLKRVTGTNTDYITSDNVLVTYLNFATFENSASTTGAVITATATSTRYGITVQYNSTNPQFFYQQSATSTEIVGNKL